MEKVSVGTVDEMIVLCRYAPMGVFVCGLTVPIFSKDCAADPFLR